MKGSQIFLLITFLNIYEFLFNRKILFFPVFYTLIQRILIKQSTSFKTNKLTPRIHAIKSCPCNTFIRCILTLVVNAACPQQGMNRAGAGTDSVDTGRENEFGGSRRPDQKLQEWGDRAQLKVQKAWREASSCEK